MHSLSEKYFLKFCISYAIVQNVWMLSTNFYRLFEVTFTYIYIYVSIHEEMTQRTNMYKDERYVYMWYKIRAILCGWENNRRCENECEMKKNFVGKKNRRSHRARNVLVLFHFLSSSLLVYFLLFNNFYFLLYNNSSIAIRNYFKFAGIIISDAITYLNLHFIGECL